MLISLYLAPNETYRINSKKDHWQESKEAHHGKILVINLVLERRPALSAQGENNKDGLNQ